MVEIQDIFRMFGEEYRQKYTSSFQQLKAMAAIEHCRTAAMGGHMDQCDSCGHERISYNSCRNRRCPKCQRIAKEKWVDEQKENLLPIQYFHIVFTIPDKIYPIAFMNQKQMYTILFRAASETLQELARDKKYLGAEIGFSSILHTWGQNLMFHPHLHCIVTGGGLTTQSQTWVHSRKKFFIPVKVISRKFRGKFLFYLKQLYLSEQLKCEGDIKTLKNKGNFFQWLDDLYQKEWVVYSKAPFKSAEYVLGYLGRYTHRVAISNDRIKEIKHKEVTFQWKDYKEKIKTN